jgi:hypothetical protein
LSRNFCAAAIHRIRIKESDAQRLREEYNRLVQGLRESSENRMQDLVMGNPGVLGTAPFAICAPWMCQLSQRVGREFYL